MRIWGLALLGVMPFAAHAQNLTLWNGNGFYDACIAQQKIPLAACQGYIMGIHDASVGTAPNVICLPPGFVYQQGYDMLVNELRAHPETRQNKTANIYVGVLWGKFLCGLNEPRSR